MVKGGEGIQVVACLAGVEAGRQGPGQPGRTKVPLPIGVENEGSPLGPVYEPIERSGGTGWGSLGAKRTVGWMEKGPLVWGSRRVLPYDERRGSSIHLHPQ